jgi:uncharacterized membrane protein
VSRSHGDRVTGEPDEFPVTLSPQHPVTRAVALGIVAGMRSQMPLALLALAANQKKFAPRAGPPLGLLRSPIALGVLGLAGIGELIVDKLPFTPNRTEPGSLVGRTISGGIAGAAIGHDRHSAALKGAFAGAVAAGLATEGTYHLRAAAGRITGLPDPLLGAVEDALAIALGAWAIRGK